LEEEEEEDTMVISGDEDLFVRRNRATGALNFEL